MLFIKNLLDVRLKKKLSYKFTRSFEIKNIINSQAYRLRLFAKWRIYLVFYILLLKLYHRNLNIVAPKNMILIDKNKK